MCDPLHRAVADSSDKCTTWCVKRFLVWESFSTTKTAPLHTYINLTLLLSLTPLWCMIIISGLRRFHCIFISAVLARSQRQAKQPDDLWCCSVPLPFSRLHLAGGATGTAETGADPDHNKMEMDMKAATNNFKRIVSEINKCIINLSWQCYTISYCSDFQCYVSNLIVL